MRRKEAAEFASRGYDEKEEKNKNVDYHTDCSVGFRDGHGHGKRYADLRQDADRKDYHRGCGACR